MSEKPVKKEWRQERRDKRMKLGVEAEIFGEFQKKGFQPRKKSGGKGIEITPEPKPQENSNEEIQHKVDARGGVINAGSDNKKPVAAIENKSEKVSAESAPETVAEMTDDAKRRKEENIKNEKENAEYKLNNYKVEDRRYYSAKQRAALQEEPVKKEVTPESKPKKVQKWETVSGRSGGQILVEEGMTLPEINQRKIDEMDWEKSSEKSRASMPKEKIEEFDDSFMKKLEKEVEAKRNRYAMAEYNVTNVVSRIKKILPFVKTDPRDVSEVQGYYTDYKISQNMLLDQMIQDLKAKGLSGDALKKEMGNLVNYFKIEEKRKLFESHTNSRAKTIEEKVSDKTGKIMELSSRYINWYRKQPVWGKTLAGLSLSSFGLGIISRVHGAALGSVGTKVFADSIYRKMEARKAKKETKKILGKLESEEDKYNKLYEYIEEDIKKSASKLKKEKLVSILTTAAGAGVGYAIGSGATAELIKWGAGPASKALSHLGNLLGINEYIASPGENINEVKAKASIGKIADIQPEQPSGAKIANQPETIQTKPAPTVKNPEVPEVKAGAAPTEPSTAPAPEKLPVSETIPEVGKSLEIKSGGSLWQALQENGMDNKQISSMLNEYAERNGLDLKSLDEMYPGQIMELSPDGKSIERILESHDSHLIKTIKGIANGSVSEGREIKGLGFGDIEKPELTKSLAKAMEKYHEILGDAANPNIGETIQNWVARMANMAMEKQ